MALSNGTALKAFSAVSHKTVGHSEQCSTVFWARCALKLWTTAHLAEVNCGPLLTLPEKLRTTKFRSKTVRYSPAPLPKTVEHCAIQNCGHPPKKQSLEYLQLGSPDGAASFAGTSLLPADGTRYLAAHGVAFSFKVESDFQDPKLVSPRLPLPVRHPR